MNSTPALTLAYPALAETTSSDPSAETYYQLVTSSNTTVTVAISNALKFAASKSVRTSTVILATFNALAALATALGIIHSCRQYKKRAQRRLSEPPSGLFNIHTVEVFPFILSAGIVIQSLIFAGAQAGGLQALLSGGCTITAIFVLPALFLVPFTHLVFGIELAARGIRWQFAPRGKWNVAKCLGVVAVMATIALVVAATNPANDFCFASLFWFLHHYAPGCFGVFVTITILQLAAIVTTFFQLNKSHMVDAVEKTAASRMIYYLTLGFISNTFMIPFFFSLTFLNQEVVIYMTLDLSMAASVVANVNGLMVTGLHLFLKSQANSQLVNSETLFEHKKSFYDRRDSRESEYSLQPIKIVNEEAWSRNDGPITFLHAADQDAATRSSSAQRFGSMSHESISPGDVMPSELQLPDRILLPSEASPSQLRKQQMPFYPPISSAVPGLLPATTYSPLSPRRTVDSLMAAPIAKPWARRGHRRGSSVGSTATVQIGIRISNMGAILSPKKSAIAFSKTSVLVPDVPPLPVSSGTEAGAAYASEDMGRFIILDDLPRRRSQWETRLKALPPTPLAPVARISRSTPTAPPTSEAPVSPVDTSDAQLMTLSPAVYTPAEEFPPRRSPSSRSIQRLPSPRSVGYQTSMSRSNSAAHRSANTPPPSPPRSASGAATTLLHKDKANWI
ncbi:hypothetical protein BD289DRAFT_121708 [Coniella lustricola]|uniref:Uncharacterized protein n=1 Tax=Coniella lustricola TaxID=2025994 RepID=A0A2T2ZWM6_9PEZI|nr:hypothetical protein BD289DRAFT_121708 [Coniella lustricola]